MNPIHKRPRDVGALTTPLNVSNGTWATGDHSRNTVQCNMDILLGDIQSALTTKQRLSTLKRLRYVLRQGIGDSCSSMSQHSSQQSSQLSPITDNENYSAFADEWATCWLDQGVLTSLYMQLHNLLHRHGSSVAEIELLTHCIDLVFRKYWNWPELQKYIHLDGRKYVDLLPEAVQFVKQKRTVRAYTRAVVGGSSSGVPAVEQSVVSIFHVISGGEMGSSILLDSQEAVLTIMNSLRDKLTTDKSCSEALGAMKNVTYFEQDSCFLLIKFPWFLSALLELPHPVQRLSCRTLQRLSCVLRNVSCTVECRAFLVRQPAYIGVLVELLTWEPSATEHATSDYSKIRRNILNVLVGVSMDHDSSLLLIFHGDGIILGVLKRCLCDPADAAIRKKAACILRLIANEATAPLLIHDASLMHTLSAAAIHDRCSHVRKEAAQAFGTCAALVRAEQQPHYQAVLDALTLLANSEISQRRESVPVLARALKEQSSHACNRKAMAERIVLLEAIAKMAMLRDPTITSAIEDACCTLSNLCQEPDNLHRLARLPSVLDALLTNAVSYNEASLTNEFTSTKQFSIEALACLAACPNNRCIMNQHGCLLQTMIQITPSISCSTVKADTKKAILLLSRAL